MSDVYITRNNPLDHLRKTMHQQDGTAAPDRRRIVRGSAPCSPLKTDRSLDLRSWNLDLTTPAGVSGVKCCRSPGPTSILRAGLYASMRHNKERRAQDIPLRCVAGRCHRRSAKVRDALRAHGVISPWSFPDENGDRLPALYSKIWCKACPRCGMSRKDPARSAEDKCQEPSALRRPREDRHAVDRPQDALGVRPL
jgi:hypothetical protein